jgi:hypothetical protein
MSRYSTKEKSSETTKAVSHFINASFTFETADGEASAEPFKILVDTKNEAGQLLIEQFGDDADALWKYLIENMDKISIRKNAPVSKGFKLKA